MTLAAFFVALAGCAALGWPLLVWLSRPEDSRAFRAALAIAAGSLVASVGMELLTLLSVRWRPSVLFLLAIGGSTLGLLAARGRARAPRMNTKRSPGWSLAFVSVALLAVALAVVLSWSVNPDFIYHWGIKGHRFFVAGGLDPEFLVQPWNRLRHPDYPNMLPALFAATATIAGRFEAPGMLAWSALHFALLFIAAHETLQRNRIRPWLREATLASTSMFTAAFGLGFLLLGGPDPILALVPLLAWPALSSDPDRRADLQIGLAAALAAAAKIEGFPLAAALIAVSLIRRGSAWRSAVPSLLGPAAVVAGIWYLYGLRHGLFLEAHIGPPHWSHLGVIARGVLAGLRTPEFHGATVAFLALPLMLALRRSRAIAAVLALQGAFFLFVYLTWPASSPAETDFFVRSNCPRLLFQLLPATLIGCGFVLDRFLGGEPKPEVSAVSCRETELES